MKVTDARSYFLCTLRFMLGTVVMCFVAEVVDQLLSIKVTSSLGWGVAGAHNIAYMVYGVLLWELSPEK